MADRYVAARHLPVTRGEAALADALDASAMARSVPPSAIQVARNAVGMANHFVRPWTGRRRAGAGDHLEVVDQDRVRPAGRVDDQRIGRVGTERLKCLAQVADPDASDVVQIEPAVAICWIRGPLVEHEVARTEAGVQPLVLAAPEPARIVAAAGLLLAQHDDHGRGAIGANPELEPLQPLQVAGFER